MATNTNVRPLVALPFFKNMGYKISDSIRTLLISQFVLLDAT